MPNINYDKEVQEVISGLGLKGAVEKKQYVSCCSESEKINLEGIDICVKITKYGNVDKLEAEIAFVLPEEGVTAVSFIEHCAKAEGLKQTRDYYYGISKDTYLISPWNNNYFTAISRTFPSGEVAKAVEELVALGSIIVKHIPEYTSLRRWKTTDPEVVAKAKEIVTNASFRETDIDRENRAHYLRDENSFVKGWFFPFNDKGRGTFDTVWPSSVEYAALNFGDVGSFNFCVGSLVLEDPDCIAKARKACVIRKETTVTLY